MSMLTQLGREVDGVEKNKAFWGMDSVEDFGPLQITPDETEPILWWTNSPKCLDIITSITFNPLQSFVERVFQAVLRPTEKLRSGGIHNF